MEIPFIFLYLLFLGLWIIVLIFNPSGNFKNKGKTVKADLIGYRSIKSDKPYQILLKQRAIRPVFQYGESDDLKTVTAKHLDLLIPERKGLDLSFHDDLYIESLSRTNTVLVTLLLPFVFALMTFNFIYDPELLLEKIPFGVFFGMGIIAITFYLYKKYLEYKRFNSLALFFDYQKPKKPENLRPLNEEEISKLDSEEIVSYDIANLYLYHRYKRMRLWLFPALLILVAFLIYASL